MAARNEMAALRESESALTAAVKRGRYTRDQRDAARRRESPQPEFTLEVSGGESTVADSKLTDGDSPSSTAGGSTQATAGRVAKPFDEIEDY